jgi:UbiD family decarboxylase
MGATPAAADHNRALDRDLRGYLETNADIVTRITRPVSIDDIGALSAQSDGPIVFENIIEKPGFRMADMFVRNRRSQARALNVAPEEFLRTLAFRLRHPPRGTTLVETAPVHEVVLTGAEIDLGLLPVPYHTDHDGAPYITAMCVIRDPETGFLNTSHPRTMCVGRNRGLCSFATPHSVAVIKKYRAMGATEMPLALIIGLPPAYEIMGNFSGLHMDMWGEIDMVGTIMDRDIEMVRCKTIDLTVPAHAEIVIEGTVNLSDRFDEGQSPGPALYFIPRIQKQPEFIVSAITMREDRPIYRNHQSCPETDHQPLPRLCHEAVLYNRLSELGLDMREVQFPSWGAAQSVILQFDYPRPGMVNDALMAAMGAPWLNTKMVVAVSPDTDIANAGEVYHAIATRCDPARDIIIVPATRGSPYDPSAEPLPDHYPFRLVGKIGIDATIKARHERSDFERTWPKNWGKVMLEDYL